MYADITPSVPDDITQSSDSFQITMRRRGPGRGEGVVKCIKQQQQQNNNK